MSQLNGVLQVFLILLFVTFGVPLAFAEIPSFDKEYDFTFKDPILFQNTANLYELKIRAIVDASDSNLDLGSVVINAIVTDPNGNINEHSAKINDMQNGTSNVIGWAHNMSIEGTYSVDIVLENVSDLHSGHVFDREILF